MSVDYEQLLIHTLLHKFAFLVRLSVREKIFMPIQRFRYFIISYYEVKESSSML